MDDLSQTVAIHSAGTGLLDDVPVEKVAEFEQRVMDHLRTGSAALCAKLAGGAKMDDATVKELDTAVSELARTLR